MNQFMPKRVKVLKPSNRHAFPRSPDMVSNTSMQLITPIHHQEPEFINLIPNGFYIETKRSAVTLFSLFTDSSMEHRDPYLKAMLTFREIAIKRTMEKLKLKYSAITNPSLPVSFETLSAFDDVNDKIAKKGSFSHELGAISDPTGTSNGPPFIMGNHSTFFAKHQMTHKAIFERFAQYRKNDNTKFNDLETVAKTHIPPRRLFFDRILPFFEMNILDMIPIFNMRILTNELDILYTRVETESTISLKQFDHVVYCICLLYTSRCV